MENEVKGIENKNVMSLLPAGIHQYLLDKYLDTQHNYIIEIKQHLKQLNSLRSQLTKQSLQVQKSFLQILEKPDDKLH